MRSILKSLLKPDAYPDPTTKIELVQTHVSWIFLTDRFAYKIKKPVDFGFLNFSSIDRRRFYCNEEVKYNSRLCPDIYLGVVELRQTAEGAAFHGSGPVIDYAVKMVRLPADRMLDKLVANNLATAVHLRSVAHVIADFHRTAATSPSISEYGHRERILYNWQENFEQVVTFEEKTLPAADREHLRYWVSEFIEEHADLFDERVRAHYIRECDGDIHLENICLLDDKICIFDCIEFSERFRCCDTAADLAFLLMDLDFHGRHDLAEAAFSAYVERSGDTSMKGLIDFYKVYRAFVRGKVESFRLLDQGIELQQQAEAKEKAIRYFRLARGYIEQRRLGQTLFITCGLMGCGKTTLARQMAFELGIPVHSSDVVRKQLVGLPPDSPCPDDYGQGLYSEEANSATYDELLKRAEQELVAGSSVILDASFIRKADRTRCAGLARALGVRFVVLHLSCAEGENRRRLVERLGSRSASDGRAELLAAQRASFEPPGDDEGTVVAIHAEAPPATSMNAIYQRLGA